MTPRVLAVDEPACLALPQDGSTPRRIGHHGSPFSVRGCCSRKQGRLDWHRLNIPQLAQVAQCSSAPKITAVLLYHGSFPPHHSHTRPCAGVGEGLSGSLLVMLVAPALALGVCKGLVKPAEFPRGTGGVYGPAYHAAPLIPLIGAGRRVQPCEIRILPAGAAGGEGSSPSLTARTKPTHPPAHGPGATGRSHGGSGHMGDPVTLQCVPGVLRGGIYRPLPAALAVVQSCH